MPWPTLSDPVPATVITAAWEIANPLAAVRWLRQLMGNTDPPGSGAYVVVSSSATAASWAKVPPDALAVNAARDNLGYTPVNKAGDVNVGALSLDGDLTMANSTVRPKGVAVGTDGIANAGPYAGGRTDIGTVSLLGEVVGLNGISCAGPIVATGGISTQGAVTPGIYAGGSIGSGSPQVLGLSVGLGGIACAGPVVVTGAVTARGSLSVLAGLTAGTYGGGSTVSGGTVQVQGLQTGSSGILAGGPLNATSVQVGGQDVYSPTNPPPSAIPSGLIALWTTGSAPTGWTVYSGAAGRYLVAAGGSFGAVGATGGTINHRHGMDHGHSGTADNNTQQASGTGQATPAVAAAAHPHNHTFTIGQSSGVNTGQTTVGDMPPWMTFTLIQKS